MDFEREPDSGVSGCAATIYDDLRVKVAKLCEQNSARFNGPSPFGVPFRRDLRVIVVESVPENSMCLPIAADAPESGCTLHSDACGESSAQVASHCQWTRAEAATRGTTRACAGRVSGVKMLVGIVALTVIAVMVWMAIAADLLGLLFAWLAFAAIIGLWVSALGARVRRNTPRGSRENDAGLWWWLGGDLGSSYGAFTPRDLSDQGHGHSHDHGGCDVHSGACSGHGDAGGHGSGGGGESGGG